MGYSWAVIELMQYTKKLEAQINPTALTRNNYE